MSRPRMPRVPWATPRPTMPRMLTRTARLSEPVRKLVAQKVQQNPMGSLLIAGCIGFALALLMTRPPRRAGQSWGA
jgi:hypothetical protein